MVKILITNQNNNIFFAAYYLIYVSIKNWEDKRSLYLYKDSLQLGEPVYLGSVLFCFQHMNALKNKVMII